MPHEPQHFTTFVGFGARMYGHVETAIARFELAKSQLSSVPSLQLACDFELGWSYYFLNDFSSCERKVKEFLKDYSGLSFQAFAAYVLGVSYHMLNQPADAELCFKIVQKKARPNFSYDQVRLWSEAGK